jgi:uncharacterized damage-inducible protein DinB
MKMSATARALRPDANEYASYFETYVSLVPEGDVVEALSRQLAEVTELFGGIAEEHAGHAYAEGKWSIKQVVGHVVDGERIFAYRALAVARGEQQPLPGMEQDEYMAHSDFDSRTLADLAAEFAHARASNVLMFRGLSEEAWLRRGTANEREVSVRALAHIIVGHVAHHVNVLRARYL